MNDPIAPNDPSENELDLTSATGAAQDEARGFRGVATQMFGGKRAAMVGGAVFLLAIVIVVIANTSKHITQAAKIADTPNIQSTQATKPVSAAYGAEIKSSNAQDAEAALQNGGSSIATPILQPPAPPPTDTTSMDDPGSAPTVDFSPTQSAVNNNTNGASPPQQSQNQDPPHADKGAVGQSVINQQAEPGYDKNVADAMLDAMKGLQSRNYGGPQTLVASYFGQSTGQVGTGGTGNPSIASGAQGNSQPAQAGSLNGDSQKSAGAMVPAAGTILYARMIGELNSDAPGPAIATIVAGPLAGARVIGSFETARAGLVIKFTTMTVPADDESGTITTSINAIAVSSDNLTSGMETSYNSHFVTNLGVTFVAGFAQGFGQAIAQSGSTVTNTGTGLSVITNPTLTLSQELASATGTAAGAAGSQFQQMYGNRPPTIKLAAGTPFALVFLGADTGVNAAQQQLQTVNPQSANSPNATGDATNQQSTDMPQKNFTPTLPVRSFSGLQTYGGQMAGGTSN